jgi:hypothetical protein
MLFNATKSMNQTKFKHILRQKRGVYQTLTDFDELYTKLKGILCPSHIQA